jgi:hypothetical protein
MDSINPDQGSNMSDDSIDTGRQRDSLAMAFDPNEATQSAPVSIGNSPKASSPQPRKQSLHPGKVVDDRKTFQLLASMHQEMNKKDVHISQLKQCLGQLQYHMLDASHGQVCICLKMMTSF